MILFFITNSLYKSHINRRINKLKTKYSSSKLELECKKRGGTNIWIFLIVLVIELSLTSFDKAVGVFLQENFDSKDFLDKCIFK